MLFNKLVRRYYQRVRISLYKRLSTNYNVTGNPICYQPVIFKGHGSISFGKNVILGIDPSPFFFNGAIYIEARHENSQVIINDNVHINNNFSLIADRSSIKIESDVLIGPNVTLFDSDFHGIDPRKRLSQDYECKSIIIERNVFIGANCTILKGVRIGQNSIIGNGSIVVKDIPENVIAAGNPARVIKQINTDNS